MWLGLDPDLAGAVAVLMPTGTVVFHDIPVVGKEVDLLTLHRIVQDYRPASVALEALGMRPRQAGVQTLVRNWQRCEDAIIFSGMPLTIVPPKVWQAGIVPAAHRGDRKATIAAYCNYAKRQWPAAELIPAGCRVIRPGRAAALCMADWLRRRNGGAS